MPMEVDSPEAAEWSRLMSLNSQLEHALTIAEPYMRTALQAARTIAPNDFVVKRATADLEIVQAALRRHG